MLIASEMACASPLAILAAEEAKWVSFLGASPSWQTNAFREVKHKTLHVAQKRSQTALNWLMPKPDAVIDPEIVASLDKVRL